MPRFIDLSGQRFGRWTVIDRAQDHFTKSGTRITMWNCSCDCGNRRSVSANSLREGKTMSCGCYVREINGARFAEMNRKKARFGGASNRDKLFHVWKAIIRRCTYENDKYFYIYGGRGITICNEWKEDYLSFRKWALESGWKDGLSIDRIDCNGNYCPENCRWATAKEQANNRRNNRMFTAFGETLNIGQWSERFKISYNKLRYRLIEKGLTIQDALKELEVEVNMP